MAKKVKTVVKLQIPAGGATPAPPVGTALGPHGINIQEFVTKFNDATQDKKGNIIPVELSIFEDRSFDFKLKTPPASDLLRKAAGVEKGSGEVPRVKAGKISKAQLRQIAEQKMEDLSANDVDAASKIIAGTAKSMGIDVEK
ncbi:MAG: 50S ribosomal protein L11 [Candidatus Spechtbacterales bacterium]